MAGSAEDALAALKRTRRPHGESGTDPSCRVSSEIANAILEQRLRPGAKLGEQVLSEIFGVNRPVVRRALMRLSWDRLVEIRPHRGAFVASPDIEEARQIFEARRLAEDWVVRHLGDGLDPKAQAQLERHVEEENAAALNRDRAKWIRATGEFHVLLATMTGNEVIARFLEDLVARTSLIISLYGARGEALCPNCDHREIVAALGRGDAEAAASAMRTHLESCEAALHFEERTEGHDLRGIFNIMARASV
ncbi:MAG: GntR family transcriptional regulator [Rhodothalassiaceae bacterium]